MTEIIDDQEMTQQVLFELANACSGQYRLRPNVSVQKTFLKSNIEAFLCLAFYADRKVVKDSIFGAVRIELPHFDYYIGNLISSGQIEGVVRDVIGTLPEAVLRTLHFIDQSPTISGAQAEFYSRNLKVLLEKESSIHSITLFREPIAEALCGRIKCGCNG